MEETCVNSGWEFVVYMGDDDFSFERVKPLADDPAAQLGPYYQQHVAGKNWLHLATLALWLIILITYVIWRSCLLGRICCCREIPAKLNRIECYKILTDGWATLNKVVVALFGILVIAACVFGICTLTSKQYLASDGSQIMEDLRTHFHNFDAVGSQLSSSFQQLPQNLKSQTDNTSTYIQNKLDVIQQSLQQIEEIVTNTSEKISENVVSEIMIIQEDYNSQVQKAFDIFHIVAVYVIFPVVILCTLFTVILGCINCVLGIEISVFSAIIATFVLMAAGTFMSAIAVTDNDICAQIDSIVVYKLEKYFGSSSLFIDFVRNQFITNYETTDKFLDKQLNLSVNRLLNQIDQVESEANDILEVSDSSKFETQKQILNIREKLIRFVRYLDFEKLKPFYMSLKELTCCDFKEYLIRYNFVAFLASILMLPVVMGLMTWSQRLQKLPPAMVTCGACHVRSGVEFEVNSPRLPRQQSPKVLNYQIFSRSRRQTESFPPTLFADQVANQNSQLIVNVPQAPNYEIPKI